MTETSKEAIAEIIDAPDRIWLQDDGDYSKARLAIGDLTWYEDQINDADTEYVRADLHAEAIEAIRTPSPTPTTPVTVQEAARVLLNVLHGWDDGTGNRDEWLKLMLAAAFGAQAFTVTPLHDAKVLAMLRAFLTAAVDDSDPDLDWLRGCNKVRALGS